MRRARRAVATMMLGVIVAVGVAVSTVQASVFTSTGRLTVGQASTMPLQAFVLAGAPDSLTDLEAHARDIGVVYPTLYECAPRTDAIVVEGTAEPASAGTGAGTGAGSGAETGAEIGAQVGAEANAITVYARAQNIAVLPRFSCQDGATVHTILTEPRARARTIAGLVQIAESRGYAGVNLDMENDAATDRDALTSFVTVLARELHAHGEKLAVDVDGVTHEDPAISTGFYDDRALAAAADYVFVIAWGTHWAGSAPGPIAPLSYVSSVAHYLASLPHADRFVLGVPMYGLDWLVPAARFPRPQATALQYTGVLALARSTGATPTHDRSVDEMTFAYTRAGVTHRVWYMDAQSIADRLRIAREYGLQAGVWRLGEEDQALWSSPFV